MNDQNEQQDKLEMYLDGMLPESEHEAFLKHHDPDELRQAQATQDQIDESLRSMFRFDPLDSAQVQELTRKAFESDSSGSVVDKPSPLAKLSRNQSATGRWFAVAVLAASVLAFISGGLWWMNSNLPVPVEFQNQPVASLYQKSVQTGFRPYYHCEDDQRFADTFEKRLGKAVKLTKSEMPEGTRMLGLSYLGGTSRESIAMLSEVDGHRVIVFVDRDGADQPDVTTEGAEGLNVFVVKRDGLVFAEVSPLEEAKMIQHLKVLSE